MLMRGTQGKNKKNKKSRKHICYEEDRNIGLESFKIIGGEIFKVLIGSRNLSSLVLELLS